MTDTRLDVAYIGGSGRSGSTVLALILGRIDGLVSVGELGHLWERGLQDNELCGCGAPFRDCEFWRRVGDEAFGGWDEVDVADLVELRRTVVNIRRAPLLLAPSLRSGFEERVRRYAAQTQLLYQAVRRVSGSRIVVDSSKSPTLALLLRHMPEVRARVVHLVRDSRGVAYSWTKQVRRPEATRASRAYMVRYSPARSSLEWAALNVSFDVMRTVGIPRLRIRYEDLAAAPDREVARVLSFVGAPAHVDLGFLRGEAIEMEPQHTVSGNPLRFQSGPLRLRLDDEWRSRMRRRDRALVLALTWPLELAYGYGWKSNGHAR